MANNLFCCSKEDIIFFKSSTVLIQNVENKRTKTANQLEYLITLIKRYLLNNNKEWIFLWKIYQSLKSLACVGVFFVIIQVKKQNGGGSHQKVPSLFVVGHDLFLEGLTVDNSNADLDVTTVDVIFNETGYQGRIFAWQIVAWKEMCSKLIC